jgi:tRNA threonylcarbamoyl adenosine modification protein (Sua5/YciO/YrdC/YwlC family)
VAADEVIAALGAGLPVLLPTDTVYGLAASPAQERFAAGLYELKGREHRQPVALVASSVERLFELVPELDRTIVSALLPGPFTLVLANPAHRYPWLTGERPDTIGVRVPAVTGEPLRVLDAVGCVAATSANDPGGPDPVSLDDVPARIRAGCGAELDVGRLPGIASTVLDFTGPEPRVLREGAAPSAEALARVHAASSR